MARCDVRFQLARPSSDRPFVFEVRDVPAEVALYLRGSFVLARSLGYGGYVIPVFSSEAVPFLERTPDGLSWRVFWCRLPAFVLDPSAVARVTILGRGHEVTD